MTIKTRKVISLKPTKRKDGSLSCTARYFHPDYSHCEAALSGGRRYCAGHEAGTVSDSEAEALGKGWALQTELAGSSKPMISTDPADVTMNELCGLWLSTLPNADIIERTKRGYAERWRAVTNRDLVIGMTPVASVTKLRAVGWLTDSRELGHSNSTMKQFLTLLHNLAEYAIFLDLVTENFTDGIKLSMSKQGKAKKRVRMTPDDLRAVAIELRKKASDSNSSGTLADAIELNSYLGLRLGELLGLRASDIDRSSDTYVINITQQWDERAKTDTGRGDYVDAKREKARSVPVTLPHVRKLIDKHLMTYDPTLTKHGIMFATRNGTHFQQSNFRKVWDRAIRDLGIKARPMPGADPFGKLAPHSMRATMIDYWIDAGMAFEAVAAMVGHSSPDFTRKVYYRDLTIDDTTEAMLAVTAKAIADAAPLAEVINL